MTQHTENKDMGIFGFGQDQDWKGWLVIGIIVILVAIVYIISTRYNEPEKKSQVVSWIEDHKYLIGGITIVLLIIIGYLVYAYNTHNWPFNNNDKAKTDKTDKTDKDGSKGTEKTDTTDNSSTSIKGLFNPDYKMKQVYDSKGSVITEAVQDYQKQLQQLNSKVLPQKYENTERAKSDILGVILVNADDIEHPKSIDLTKHLAAYDSDNAIANYLVAKYNITDKNGGRSATAKTASQLENIPVGDLLDSTKYTIASKE